MHQDVTIRYPAAAHSFWRMTGWVFLTLVVLVVLPLGFIVLAPDTWLRSLVGDRASDKLGRTFAIDGPIHIHWDWTEPYVEVNKVRLANAPGAADSNMVDIDQIDFHIKIWNLLRGQLNLPDLTLVRPKIILEKYDADHKNWEFPALSKANAVTRATLPTKRSNFPLIGALSITDGTLIYRDKTLDLDTTLAIGLAKGSSTDQFELLGKGSLQKQPFAIAAQGGSLDMLRNSDKAYPLNVHIKMGATEISVAGTFSDPVNMQGVDTKFDLHGDNLADLFYLTAIPLPPTPAYSLKGELQVQNDVWTVRRFAGRVGQSDMSGTLTDDTSGKRSVITAQVSSDNLRMEDLRGFIGANTEAQPAAKSGKLLPDVPINLTRLRASDMDIEFKANKINQPGWPIDNMDAHFMLKDGILRIDPLAFSVADGKISGPVTLNGQQDVPTMQTDLILRRLSLKPFFSGTSFESLSEGRFGGRVEINGHGRSLAEVLGDGDGRIALMMSGGSLSKLIVAAAGLDIAKVAPAYFGKDEKTGIRCAITDFGLSNGVLGSKIFIIDTNASKIDGTTNINLKDETIDAKIEGHPKDVTISGQTPILISGSFRNPSIMLDPKSLAARGGVAAALSAVLTPLAAILPFVDVEPATDSNCAALINAAKNDSGVNPTSVAPAQPVAPK